MEYGEVHVRIIHQTDMACRVEIEGMDKPAWIPWSAIENNGENFKNGYVGRMYVAKWKLDELELDYD